MNDLTYHYYAGTNRLHYVEDAVGAGVYPDAEVKDLESQAAGNYRYDNIGNLTHDEKENLDKIEWTVYGKIRKITKKDGSWIEYQYNAADQRVSKTSSATGLTTYYIRDAQGNSLAVYTDTSRSEQYLYGSSRLGVWKPSPAGSDATREYELTNHLGNVLATISDRNIYNGSYHEAEVLTQTDYYPFGMMMPGKFFPLNSNGYRYGFGGQEMNNEIKGDGNSYTATFWEYDPRLGRRWNTDPDVRYYESPYSTFLNNPIKNNDEDGDIPWDKILVGIKNPKVISSVKMRFHPVKKVWRLHKGVDIPAAIGTSVRSFAAGKVIKATYDKNGGGYYVAVKHANGYVTKYLHLKEGSFTVKVGDEVQDGQVIAQSGNTGIGTGPHLHLQVEKTGKDGKTQYLKANEVGDLQAEINGEKQPEAKGGSTSDEIKTSPILPGNSLEDLKEKLIKNIKIFESLKTEKEKLEKRIDSLDKKEKELLDLMEKKRSELEKLDKKDGSTT